MADITCSKCKTTKPMMADAPMGGPRGKRIHEKVCETCWNEWTTQQTKVVNEYRLNLANPKARELLFDQMETFLGISEKGSSTLNIDNSKKH